MWVAPAVCVWGVRGGDGAAAERGERGGSATVPRQQYRQFQKHQRDFPGVKDMHAYEQMAIAFVTGDRPGIEECWRSDGDTQFFDPVSGEFAVCSADGVIRTYITTTRAYYERGCDE